MLFAGGQAPVTGQCAPVTSSSPSFLFCKVGVLPTPASQDGQVAAKSECLGAEVLVGRVLKAAPPAPLVLVLSQPPASRLQEVPKSGNAGFFLICDFNL